MGKLWSVWKNSSSGQSHENFLLQPCSMFSLVLTFICLFTNTWYLSDLCLSSSRPVSGLKLLSHSLVILIYSHWLGLPTLLELW
ncbi:hypothetical protein EV401DRAFT_240078 [Pisolithus croceorrhizus]|nr:hypothetical protein EV401DRAFT_240078 [Pisolithus croceorrhizus]